MKTTLRILITLMGLILMLPLQAQRRGQDILQLKTKTEKEHTWNPDLADWQLTALMNYSYNDEGKELRIVKYDVLTGDSISSVEYKYNPLSQLESYDVSLWDGEEWILSTRYAYTYISDAKASQRILLWDGTQWNISRLDTLFQYDSGGLLVQSENFRWKNDAWIPDHTIYYEYGVNGKMALKYSLSPAGEYLSRVIYNYDAYNRLIEMYAQFYSNDNWDNGWRREYHYDRCGVLKRLIRQGWSEGQWVNLLMSEFEHTVFWNGPADGKVNICHNGHTITVSVMALDAHLSHGDCIGTCEVEVLDDNEEYLKNDAGSNKKEAWIIYPNPASDQFTITSSDYDAKIERIDIFNTKGNLMKTVNGNGRSEITIDGGTMKPGRYFVIISGSSPYTSVLVIK